MLFDCCPTPAQPGRTCRGARVLTCLVDAQAAHDCVEREPRATRATAEVQCARPRRGLQQVVSGSDRTCAPSPRPRSGEPVARSEAWITQAPGKGQVTYDTGNTRASYHEVDLVRDHADDVLRAMRCQYAIAGLDGRGAALKLWVNGLDATRAASGGLSPPAALERETATVYLAGLQGAGGIAYAAGQATTGGLGVFRGEEEDWRPETEALDAGFAQINEIVVDDALPPTADGPRTRLAVARDLAERGPAARWASLGDVGPDEGGRLAVAIYRGLAPLVARQPSAQPVGCAADAAARPEARWWAETLKALAATGSGEPDFVEWCEATVTTGAARGVSRQAVADVFRRAGVPCGIRRGSTRSSGATLPFPEACRAVPPTATRAGWAFVATPGCP